jgi:hypothetical protein
VSQSTTTPYGALAWTGLDFRPAHRQPAWPLVVLATIISLAGSLAADALLVAIGTRVFPSTKGYVHFQFSDYSKLTIIGVLVACVGWPVITRISSNPKRLYLLLAIATTIVLFAPDLWILHNGAPARAVAVLMVMHVAIAVVTYLVMVYVAPIRKESRRMSGQ